jgi:hypothetical protein
LCGKFIVQAGMSTSVFHDREVYHWWNLRGP